MTHHRDQLFLQMFHKQATSPLSDARQAKRRNVQCITDLRFKVNRTMYSFKFGKIDRLRVFVNN